MILVPSKRDGQTAMQIASLIDQAQKVRCCLFQVIGLSFLDPSQSIDSFQPLADIADGHLYHGSTIVVWNLPMNPFDLAATEFTVRFKDSQKWKYRLLLTRRCLALRVLLGGICLAALGSTQRGFESRRIGAIAPRQTIKLSGS
jgi:hypothetical protein